MKDFASGGHPEQISNVSKIKIPLFLCGAILPSCFGSPPLHRFKEKTTGFLLSIRFASFLGASIINLRLTVCMKTPLCQGYTHMHLLQLPKSMHSALPLSFT